MMQGLSRRIAVTLAVLSLATAAGGWALWAAPAGASASFSPELAQATQPTAPQAVTAAVPYTLTKAQAKRETKIAKAKAKATRATRTARAKSQVRSTRSKRSAKRAGSSSGGGSIAQARAILAAQIARHPILAGSTVSFGDARGYQAIAYYGSGRIVISRSHTASLERIIAHEVWHIIDWRDNGKIDWGENIPR